MYQYIYHFLPCLTCSMFVHRIFNRVRIRKGRLPGVRLGRHWRLHYAAVNVWRDPQGHRSMFRSTFVRLFVHHYFTLPLGPVRLAFTELHKSARISLSVRRGICVERASNAYKTLVRLVRRSSCSATLFHRRKNAYVSHSSGNFFPYVSPYAKKRRS